MQAFRIGGPVVSSMGLVLAMGLAAYVFVSQPAAHGAPESSEASGAGEDIMMPENLAGLVEQHGGRVDFVFGDDRDFAQCHASTVVQAPNGDLVCAWFGGTKEKDPDVGVWLSRFAEGAWTAPVQAAKVRETAHWNPVLFSDSEAVYLFFKVGPDVPLWQTYWMKSKDNGVTWGAPEELVTGDVGGRGPVKNKLIVLSNGDWLAPASTEFPGRFRGAWRPFVDRSQDKGKTWIRTESFPIDHYELAGRGAIQPTLWESAPGHVHALMRATAGKAWRTDSEDYGRTWAEVYETDLPNNNSGLDALLLDEGVLLLVYNPVGMNWGPRTPLDLAVSRDNGKTWKRVAHLENDPDKESEYSYPAIVRSETGVVITYTWQRDKVRCWQIPMAALEALTGQV